MNKAQASKVAKELTSNGHSVGVRHYGKGSWAVEMEGGKVVQSVESYEEWKIAQAHYAAQAEADKAQYGYAE